MFNNGMKNMMEKEIKEQIQVLVEEIYKLYVNVRKTQRGLEIIAANSASSNPEKSKSENDYNKLFSLEEYKKLGDERKKSLELFFSCSLLDFNEHSKVLESLDEETKAEILIRMSEKLIRSLRIEK